MKLARLSSIALAAAIILPAAAQAQTEALRYERVKTEGGDKVASASTGAYQLSRAPFGTLATTFDVYCIDYDHNVQTLFTAHYVTFAQATGAGVDAAAAQRQLGALGLDNPTGTKAWGLAELRAAAYLTQQFGAVGPTNSDDNWDETHGAIWSLFSTNSALAPYTGTAAAAIAAAGSDDQWDDYVLVLDDRAWDTNFAASGLQQAFITQDGNTTIRIVTPEPSTYVLMGAGLLAVGFVRRRRRTA